MSNKDNSFENEVCSNSEEDEIIYKERTESKVKYETEELDDQSLMNLDWISVNSAILVKFVSCFHKRFTFTLLFL